MSKFRNDGNNRLHTQGLFLELGYHLDTALYTLKEQDYEYKGKLYPSAKLLYLNSMDPTEYEFAQLCFESWDHWTRIRNNKLITPYADRWKSELEVKIRSQAVGQVIKHGANGDRVASTWVAKGSWSTSVGRPSNAKIAREVEFASQVNEEYGADIVRLKR